MDHLIAVWTFLPLPASLGVGGMETMSVLADSNSRLLAIPEAIFEGHAVELCLPGTDQIMQTYELAVESSKQLNDLYFSVVLGSDW
jgi:hypothetical protein